MKELRGKTEALRFQDITSIVVLKNGKLLMEEYFNGATVPPYTMYALLESLLLPLQRVSP
jgi:hypothetical protein